MSGQRVVIEGREITLNNLEKLFWPEEGYAKAHLISYYHDVAPYLLPHLRDRPLVLVRYPDGVRGKHFYQKECPEHAPEWLTTAAVEHRGGRVVNYVLCQDRASLVWLASQGCVELHPWLARLPRLDFPDAAVFDLDPNPPAGFQDALEVAWLIRGALERLGLKAYPKTSGAGGLHLYLPLFPRYTYQEISRAVGSLSRILARLYPERITVERRVSLRGGRVYLDFPQNARGKTIASVYSLRPEPRAPVSTPLTWDEVAAGVQPADFRYDNIRERLRRVGDLFRPVLDNPQELEPLLELVP